MKSVFCQTHFRGGGERRNPIEPNLKGAVDDD